MSLASGQAMIANPLNAKDGLNKVSTIFPTMPSGTILYKWNDATQQYVTDHVTAGVWDDPNLTLAPGEGAIIYPGAAVNVSFVGEVAQGYNVNAIPNLSSIRSSIVPQAGRVQTDLGLPVISGDTVQKMVNGGYVTYTYNQGAWSPSEPIVSIGESFWNHKNVGFWWHRNFLVWP